MKQSQKIMLTALRVALLGGKASFPEDTDWDEVVKESKEQAVIGLISTVIPKQYCSDMGSVNHTIANYIRLLYDQDALLRLLDDYNIPNVIIKGCAAAVYYPKPYLREMGDIDVLVPRCRFDEAMRIMENAGYIIVGGKDEDGNLTGVGRHVEYMKNGREVELHHHFSFKGFDVDEELESGIYRREYIELNDYGIPVLPETENGLVLIGHIRQHIKINALGLRQIIDWAMYVKSIKDADKWRLEFIPVAKSAGLLKLAFVISALCEKYLGVTSILDYTDEDVKIGDGFLKMILEDGNFGRGTTLTASEKEIRDGWSYIKKNGLFTYFKDSGLDTWKMCKKCSFLTHFAWIYGMFRIIGKGIKASLSVKSIKKINKQMVSSGERYDYLKRAGIED